MYVNAPIWEETEYRVKSDDEPVVWLQETIIPFIKVMGIGQYIFDVGISAIETKSGNHF